jgi:Neuraminidase (sialidase)
MPTRLSRTALVPALLLAAALPVAGGGAVLASATAATASSSPPTPFALSGLPAESRGPSVATTPVTSGVTFGHASVSTASVTAGTNIDVIGNNDVTQQATINGISVFTCNPGKDTAQNETTIASSGSTLVAGANDYRLYEPSENRYDSSGGFYRSPNDGTTWSAGFLPGLVRADTAAPGPYESAGDPAVVAGPNGTFWYANIAFDRTDAANAVAASRSADGGKTWSTHFVIQTPAKQGTALFNDKEWIAADPSDPAGNTAYVTWTQFQGSSSAIVISKTTDGGLTWSAPQRVSNTFTNDQGSTVVVSTAGTVYVTFETFNGSTDAVAFAVSTDGGATFTTKLIAPVSDIPSPLPGATFRDDSFPALALDGSTLHVAWSNWNGTDADVVYMRSTDGGATWSGPVTIGGGAGDQFFPWIAARNGTVYASWFDRASGDTYTIAGAASTSGGASWSAPVTLSTTASNVQAGNEFSFPNCAFNFIGDYSGITVDSTGTGHPMWTDIRVDHFDPPGNADQDPFTATLTASG